MPKKEVPLSKNLIAGNGASREKHVVLLHLLLSHWTASVAPTQNGCDALVYVASSLRNSVKFWVTNQKQRFWVPWFKNIIERYDTQHSIRDWRHHIKKLDLLDLFDCIYLAQHLLSNMYFLMLFTLKKMLFFSIHYKIVIGRRGPPIRRTS